MFLSFDCIKIFTFSTFPYAPNILRKDISLQLSFFIDETCNTSEGGLTVIDRLGVNLNYDHLKLPVI